MARSRKKPPPPDAPPTAPPPADAGPAVVNKMTVAAGPGRAHLKHDRAADRWVIAFDLPDPAAGSSAAVGEHLRANGFTPADGSPGWVRPVDREAMFQDLIDAERVLLAAAALVPDAAPQVPAKRPGRGRR